MSESSIISVLLIRAHASYLISKHHVTVENVLFSGYCCPAGSLVDNWKIFIPFNYVRSAHSLLTSISLLTSDMGQADCLSIATTVCSGI